MEKKKFHIVDDEDTIKWLTGCQFYFTIEENFRQHAQLKRWCEENCADVVAFLNKAKFRYHESIFFFNEEDAMAYKLRWE